MNFFERLAERVQSVGAPLCVGLDPRVDQVPARFRRAPEPLLAWNQAVIQATADLAAAYKPNIAFYEALGRTGWDLLQATLRAIPPDVPVILDAKRGDIGSTAEAYARAAFEVLGVDAITLNPYLGRDTIAPFLAYPEKGIFLLCHTSNPGAREIQTLPVCPPDRPPTPLYREMARRALRWGDPARVGLVVGAPYPEALAAVRQEAPDTWFLVPGVGAQGGEIATLRPGLRSDGLGILVNVSRGIALAEDMRQAAETYARQLAALSPAPSPTRPRDPREELVLALHDLGAIQFGEFTLASGQRSPYYIDLRVLVSAPAVLAQAAQQYARHVRRLKPDLLAGVPYAALPIATAVSLHTGIPMIYTRKEPKAHGLGRTIEGHFTPGQQVVIIEDVVTTGGSTLQTVERLRAAGLVVEDMVVLIDREQGAREALRRAGVRLHACLRLSEVWAILRAAGREVPIL